MELSSEKFDFIRENRHEPPKKLAKALSVPVRHVDRALRQLGDRDALRRARWRFGAKVFLLLLVLVGFAYGAHRWASARARARADEEAKNEEQRNRATEQSIYSVLNKREKGHDAEVAPHLASGSETVRLAAVRYLLTEGTKETEAAFARVNDDSQRVRLATIQLMADSSSPLVEERLATVVISKTQGLPEKTLALEGLRTRPALRVRAQAVRLLDAFADPQPGVREGAHAVLSTAFPGVRVSLLADASALRSAWQAVVEARQ